MWTLQDEAGMPKQLERRAEKTSNADIAQQLRAEPLFCFETAVSIDPQPAFSIDHRQGICPEEICCHCLISIPIFAGLVCLECCVIVAVVGGAQELEGGGTERLHGAAG